LCFPQVLGKKKLAWGNPGSSDEGAHLIHSYSKKESQGVFTYRSWAKKTQQVRRAVFWAEMKSQEERQQVHS
jgi:hypothetical protein